MSDQTPETLRAAAERLRAEEAQLEGAKTILYEQELRLKAERHTINERLDQVVRARQALEYRAGELERGSGDVIDDAVTAIIDGAVAAVVSGTEQAAVGA